jgi:uncharacterized membrane protein
VDVAELLLVALRVFHAAAAMLWLGGGIYYLVAVLPATRNKGEDGAAIAGTAQRLYGEWATPATIVMLASGVVLVFDRLSEGKGGLFYAALLAAKVVAALIAFWLVTLRRGNRRRPLTGWRSRPETIVALGLFAFIMGVILSSIWQ